jgi:predicted N-formylglutamate amidohydrolase
MRDSAPSTYRPFHIFGADRPSRWLVTCDHATNRVPPEMDPTLGIAPEDMARHIAYDVGAAGLAQHLAERLGAPFIMSDFSRLVIDPNRGEDDPTLVMRLYDGTIIPSNRNVDAAEVARRLDLCYRPYHAALAQLAGRRPDTVILSVHSFTRQLRGRDPRPWHVGVLFGEDTRIAAPLVARLRAESDLIVGENEPYGGHLDGDAIDRHGTKAGRPNVLVELRNDLIGTEAEQIAWADRLASILDATLADANL